MAIPVLTQLEHTEITSASPPPAGVVKEYAKADGKLYGQDPAGTETPLGGGAGGASKAFIFMMS